ncbi:hypothetical protein [Streptomyces sp. NPDC002788]
MVGLANGCTVVAGRVVEAHAPRNCSWIESGAFIFRRTPIDLCRLVASAADVIPLAP